jgi:hypothetical protein
VADRLRAPERVPDHRDPAQAGRGVTALCGPCSALWMRWLDYELPPPPIVLCSPNRTAREIQASQERRSKEWRDTVRFHQDLIARQCREGNHYQPKEET